MYEKIQTSEIKQLEKHVSRLTYKLAVELAQINVVLSSTLDIPYGLDKQIQGKAVKMANEIKGFIPISAAVKHQFKLPFFDLTEDDN